MGRCPTDSKPESQYHAGNTCKAELLKKSGIVDDDGRVEHSINDNFHTIEYMCVKNDMHLHEYLK